MPVYTLCSAVPETLRTSGIHGIFSRVKRNKPPSRRAESGPGAASDRARRAPRASPVARLHRARAVKTLGTVPNQTRLELFVRVLQRLQRLRKI